MKSQMQAQNPGRATTQTQGYGTNSRAHDHGSNEAEKSRIRSARTVTQTESSPGPMPWETESNHESPAWWQAEAKEAPEADRPLTDTEKRKPFEAPEYRNVHGERVRVSSEWEAEEAERIMTRIEDVYAIEVGIFRDAEEEAVEETSSESEDVKSIAAKGVFGRRGGGGTSTPVPWEFKELAAIERACAHYAAILGERRKSSSRKDAQQEVDTMLKRNASGDALADYLQGADRVRFFRANTHANFDFDTNAQQLEGTAIHELAHGLCRYKLDAYAQEVGYWRGSSRNSRGETPVTQYGKESPGEDLSEAMMFYFIQPEKLKKECPKRFDFIQQMVGEWTEKKK